MESKSRWSTCLSGWNLEACHVYLSFTFVNWQHFTKVNGEFYSTVACGNRCTHDATLYSMHFILKIIVYNTLKGSELFKHIFNFPY